jgi:hypothetical protein
MRLAILTDSRAAQFCEPAVDRRTPLKAIADVLRHRGEQTRLG